MTEQELIAMARAVRERAYTPYSNFKVGAALETDDGRVFTGVNVENAAYPQSICAERTAMVKAVSEGARALRRVVVVSEGAASPCGGCRSVLAEFGMPETEVLLVDLDEQIYRTTLGELLPRSFEMSSRPKK